MRKSFVSLTAAVTVGMGSLFGGMAVKTEAASVSSLNQQKEQVHNQRSNIDSTINETEKKISNLQGQQVDVQADIQRIGLAIDNTAKGIQEKNDKIQETNAEIAKLQDDIKVIQERIQKRNELLKDRARNYQENGAVNYVGVLMGAQSFSDFIDLAGAVATIMEADQAILKQAEADKQELEQKQAQVQTDLDNLKKMKTDLEKLNNQLNSQKNEQTKLYASLQEKEKEAKDDVMDMAEQSQILAAQESAIQQAIKNEQDRQAAAAAEAARAAEAAAAAAKAPKAPKVPSGGSSGGGGTTTIAAPPVSGGSFTRPASGVVSSTYGPRWGTFHYGVDIANSGSNVAIVAAADGVVVTAHFSSSYGNVVYIAHSINGHVYTTVYAHMSRYLVSQGQTVSKGQQIGVMGSTGDSTGQHLHFELYNGGWAYHSAINPMGVVPF